MAIVTWAGCGGQIDPAVVNPRLRVVDAAGVQVAADSLRASGAALASLRGVTAGDVLVSAAGTGYLRRVVGVTRDGDALVIATAPAALDDALVEGALHSRQDLLAPGERAADRLVNVPPLTVSFDELPLFEDGDAKAALAGSVTMHPYLDVDLAVSRARVQSFTLVLHGDLDASVDLDVSAGHEVGKSFAKTVWSAPPTVLTQWIGPVPVVEVISLSLVATGEVHAGVTGAMTLGGVDAQATLAAGARYDAAAGWSGVGEHTLTLTAAAPSASVVAHAGGSVRLQARADIRFYDLAGPYVGVGPYARVELADDGGGVQRSGRIGVDGHFGGDLSIMGHHVASYDAQLFDVGRDVTF
jgi:hypothetical protein